MEPILLSADDFQTVKFLASSGFDWIEIARLLGLDDLAFFIQWVPIFWTQKQLNDITWEAVQEIKIGSEIWNDSLV